MPVTTIVATVGAASANSYVTVDEADQYFEDRLNSAGWTGLADPDDKTRALLMAARRIEQLDFRGSPVKPLVGTTDEPLVQAMKWPRYSAPNGEGWYYEDDVIPDIVKRAQMELALRILNDGTTDFFGDTGLEGFKSVTVDVITVVPNHGQPAAEIPQNIMDMLRPVLAATPGKLRLRRG